MPYQSNPKSLVNQTEIPIELPCSSGTDYVPNKHEAVDEYGSFSMPS